MLFVGADYFVETQSQSRKSVLRPSMHCRSLPKRRHSWGSGPIGERPAPGFLKHDKISMLQYDALPNSVKIARQRRDVSVMTGDILMCMRGELTMTARAAIWIFLGWCLRDSAVSSMKHVTDLLDL